MPGRSRAIALVATVLLASCGGSAVTGGSIPPSGTTAPGDSAGPSDGPASAITITRSGGIAGVHDVVEIAPDGSAAVTRKTGQGAATCTPTPEAIDRLREFDLATLGSPPSKVPIADGFNYEVVTGAGRASVGDGDEGVHGELLRVANEVVSSCLATVSGSGITS